MSYSVPGRLYWVGLERPMPPPPTENLVPQWPPLAPIFAHDHYKRPTFPLLSPNCKFGNPIAPPVPEV